MKQVRNRVFDFPSFSLFISKITNGKRFATEKGIVKSKEKRHLTLLQFDTT
jgi:hypothetical protein